MKITGRKISALAGCPGGGLPCSDGTSERGKKRTLVETVSAEQSDEPAIEDAVEPASKRARS